MSGLIRGLERVVDMNTDTTLDANREEAAHAAWRKYCISGQKPDNVPSNPNEVYKHDWDRQVRLVRLERRISELE